MIRPDRGTAEFELWCVAVSIAARPPLKGKGGYALIPWVQINELRETLDQLGVDWRTAKL